jgi:hypothetical protein
MLLKTRQKIKACSKKMREEKCSQRSRGKYLRPTPEKLKRLIELVNTLPAFDSLDLRLLHPQYLQAQTEAELQEEGGRKNAHFDIRLTGLIIEALKMKKLSPALLDYVTLGLKDSRTTLHGMIRDGGVVGRYENIWTANIRLHNLAKLAQAQGRPNFERSNLWRLFDRSYVLDEIDANGIVKVSTDLFAEAMAEEPIEATRIRECAICNRIFFAGRIDAWQCGDPKCKSALSSRLNRNPELRKLYNKARRTKRRKLNSAQKRTSK